MDSKKRITWTSLALMAFSAVWGFGNVINGFSEYGGLRACVSWIIIFAIYFVPYALMVGELGATFKEEGGGVSSWIKKLIGPTVAYYAGWTYWVVHMPYISQKPNSAVIAVSWAIFQDGRVSKMNTMVMQLICLAIFAVVLVVALRGVSIVKKIATLAGVATFVMSILFIVMMLVAPAITGVSVATVDWSWKSFMPTIDVKFFTSLSILVFAVGGCEKMSPYVNKTKDPSKDFSKGMIALAGMVAICAILGTIALAMMFDSNNIPSDILTNGAYYAFAKLGEYYHLGNFFVIVYAITIIIAQFAVMVISIDAPLRILLESTDKKYIPAPLFKQNKYGAYTNGIKMVAVIVGILIVIPAFGIKDVDVLVKWLVKVNSVCMPLRYLWVFAAYVALKKSLKTFETEYRFVKSRKIGMVFGAWCFIFTAIACILGIYSTDKFQLVLNIVTPFILLGLGFIMPKLAKKYDK